MGTFFDPLAYCAHYVIVWWYAERLSSSWSTRDSSIPLLTMTITSPLRLNSSLSCNDCSKALHVSNLIKLKVGQQQVSEPSISETCRNTFVLQSGPQRG